MCVTVSVCVCVCMCVYVCVCVCVQVYIITCVHTNCLCDSGTEWLDLCIITHDAIVQFSR